MGMKSKDKVHIAIKYVNKEIARNDDKTFTASTRLAAKTSYYGYWVLRYVCFVVEFQ